ncbi:7-deoxyloganetic acid glucosyl transferase-like [Magnolia sinica]|uniref:7-deoxyloganetic acid glucosyl transferase-like n=1 Tax=Magnolia sinica TaxID=86752 RepID=UPI0026585B3F|nr:7-deoxyloganetic acid glucosyl transferase-like [Magnolia sinica]
MEKGPTHVLIFPFPSQGHINSMLGFANMLCLAGIDVTFLNTDHTHHRLLRSNPDLLAARLGIRFRTISDGLPPDHPRPTDRAMDLYDSLRSVTKPLLQAMLAGSGRRPESDDAVTCIVADGILSFAIDVANELGIPIFAFHTASACSFWAFFCGPALEAGGEFPFEDDADMDHPIKSIPGMEAFLKRRDLPSIFRVKQLNDRLLQTILSETQNTSKASGFILNTFEDLEGPILSHIRVHFPTTYAIGPLHAHLKYRLIESVDSLPNSNLWTEDRTCMTWLDSQPSKSVLYVSFGSIAVITRDELLEFWHGLVDSHTRFLWVIRPDLVDGKGDEGQIPSELREATDERGCLVGWAPQEDVLAHSAVGGFLTHSGWNSTLESVCAGVPMICWPFFVDQQINSRYIGEVWKVGLDMKDSCDRRTVEMMIKELMEGKREELFRSMARITDLVKRSVSQGGSSYMNFEKLAEDIKSMSQRSIR